MYNIHIVDNKNVARDEVIRSSHSFAAILP